MDTIIIHVSADGNDSNTGRSADSPLASLAGARDAIRRERRRSGGRADASFEVVFAPGKYRMTETFRLDPEDSGSASAPVVYRAAAPGTVTFHCGRRLHGIRRVDAPQVLAIIPPEAAGRVWQCDLRANGVEDLGELNERGFHRQWPTPVVEAYCNGRRLQLARWPKCGFVRPRRLVEPGQCGGATSVMEYESPRHEHWVDAEDPWLAGYFRYLWADAAVKVGKIDPASHVISTDHAYCTSLGSMSDSLGGIKYYAFNLLEELSAPGEWFLSRKSGMLYFIPPDGVDPEKDDLCLVIGMLAEPAVEMDKVHHLAFRNLDFELGRHCAINMSRCHHCEITGCRIERFGGDGISIADYCVDPSRITRHAGDVAYGNCNHDCRIADCQIAWIGRCAVIAEGGDRESLLHGNIVVENNRIHDFGLVDHTYVPAVRLAGCGNRVARNLICNAPSTAIHVRGNDHLVEYNEVHSVVMESDDQGAIDIYGNPTYRGNIFRYNYFHDIGKRHDSLAIAGAAAIRLDDAICGQEIYGNVFERASSGIFGAVQINCGRDNRINDNLFLECQFGVSAGYCTDNFVWNAMRDGRQEPDFILSGLYRERYPELRGILDDDGVNCLRGNLFAGCGSMMLSQLAWQSRYKCEDNHELRVAGMDVREALAAGAEKYGFESVPLDAIGPHWHDKCAWTDTPPPVAGTPVDWHALRPMPEIHGEARISPVWHVFRCGAVNAEEVTPDPSGLARIPESISFGGKCIRPDVVEVADGELNFNDRFGENGEGRLIHVYAAITVRNGGHVTIGGGFDWWGDVWVDGNPVFSTGAPGNRECTITAIDHIFETELREGRHVIAIRLRTGRFSGSLAIAAGEDLRRIAGRLLWWKK